MTSTGGPASATSTDAWSGHAAATPRPQHLGLASGCTIAVGALALLTAAFVLLGAFFLGGIFAIGAAFDPTGSAGIVGGLLTSMILFMGVIALVYGIVTVLAGVRLNRGDSSAYSMVLALNVLSLVLAVVTLFGGGLGLVHAALSGVALWALFQPDMKAYFGR